MLFMSRSLYNRPVMSLRSGGQIATAAEPIINPHNLKILGWWCGGPGKSSLVLLTEDVREVMPQGFAINDEAELSRPEDLTRHREILNIRFKVNDFSYNDGMFVQKLYVSPSLRKIFSSEDTLIIDRSQILEVTDNYILVKDTEVKAGAEEMAPAAAVVPSG